jgi:hypothetical protein
VPFSKTRIAGSGFTVFTWNGTQLGLMQTLQDTAPAPVAGAQPIQPIDQQYPIEIVNAAAFGPGSLRLTFFETWNQNVWNQLPGFAAAQSLADVFNTQLQLGLMTCRKIIKVPSPVGSYRTKVYNNVVITDVDDGETVQISSMNIPKSITAMYTSFSVV